MIYTSAHCIRHNVRMYVDPETLDHYCPACRVANRQNRATQPELGHPATDGAGAVADPKSATVNVARPVRFQIAGKVRNVLRFEFPELSPADGAACDKAILRAMLLADGDPSDTRFAYLSPEERSALTRLSK